MPALKAKNWCIKYVQKRKENDLLGKGWGHLCAIASQLGGT